MTKKADLHYQGEVFSVELDGAAFSIFHGGDMIGCGYWSEEAQALHWEAKPLSTRRLQIDSGTLRALDYAVLENLRPYCESCCENLKLTGGAYCWPCERQFRADA